ncbi:hypothetical protein Scep_012757 [Stephania cephalantha]|uniref:Integrase catalytic domain-containing protein n=1 Tax=Stephania cephalantha TaxID=152367 RepID=A0AAP0JFP4_9MAGN
MSHWFQMGKKEVLEKFPALSSGLYFTHIRHVETNVVLNKKINDPKTFILWHDRLGHPGSSMMRRIINNSHGHPLRSHKIFSTGDYNCASCSQGKLIVKPSPSKIVVESPSFLRTHSGETYVVIFILTCGSFRYFMVLIDASTRWSHVCLLSTRNVAFARLLAQIIKLRAQFPDNPIKTIRLDNAGEFQSQAFRNYCMSIGITIEHSFHMCIPEWFGEKSLIKHIQLIAGPLIMRTKLSTSVWGHAVLHAASIIRYRPTAYHEHSPIQLVLGQQPNISHLRIFGCAVYVPIPPPNRTKMGPQRKLGIYVGFNSSSIIRYLEPLTGDLFTCTFLDCHFDEAIFPPLGGDKKPIQKEWREIAWNASTLSHYDPRTNQCELEVQKIIHLQQIANQLPDAFNDAKQVTKSHIPNCKCSARIDVSCNKMHKNQRNA